MNEQALLRFAQDVLALHPHIEFYDDHVVMCRPGSIRTVEFFDAHPTPDDAILHCLERLVTMWRELNRG